MLPEDSGYWENFQGSREKSSNRYDRSGDVACANPAEDLEFVMEPDQIQVQVEAVTPRNLHFNEVSGSFLHVVNSKNNY